MVHSILLQITMWLFCMLPIEPVNYHYAIPTCVQFAGPECLLILEDIVWLRGRVGEESVHASSLCCVQLLNIQHK